MTNREKYNFDYFTIENYRNQLMYALENGFEFISFTEEYKEKRKDIIWRHDVEFSLDIALEMAKIEKELGISSTYFFQLHSEFYNILERYFSDILLEIKSLGHHVGLHFDSHYYNIQSEYQLNQYITQDKDYFEKVFNIKLEVFSFHNTTPFTLNCRNKTYGGLLNVYSDYYRNRYNYCADSTGYWRFEVLDDVLNDKKVTHLQVLVHDAMWSNEVLSPRQRVRKSIQENADRIKDQYDRILIQFGAKNIDD